MMLQQQLNSGGGMLGADPSQVAPEGMNGLMEGVASASQQGDPNQQEQEQEGDPSQQQGMDPRQMADPSQQQQTMPQAASQPQGFYPDQQQSSVPRPHYLEGGEIDKRQEMQHMPDLDLINQRPGQEGDPEEEMPQEEGEGDHAEMILAHVGANELEKLDEMQGGRRIDQETGLPIYDGLVPFIGTPELMEIFKDVVYEIAETGELSPDKSEFISQLDPLFPLAQSMDVDGPPSEHEDFAYPEEEELAHKGLAGDHELAIIPKALADMLDEIRGETSTNPKTGLPQYFWFIPALIAAVAMGAKVWGDARNAKQTAKDMRSAHDEQEEKRRALYDEEQRYQKSMVDEIHRNVPDYRHKPFSPGVDRVLTSSEQARGLGNDQLYQRDNRQYDSQQDLINTPQQFKEGGHAAVHIAPLKETGIIEGPGKGQDDVIATSVPEKSYIIDASSVSDLGDGSSEAGAEVFDNFFEELRGRPAKANHAAREVPVYLSNDEYLIDESDVTLLGGGDNNKGAKLLKSIVKNIRQHKSSNGSGLPPKAKDLVEYFPRKKG